MIHREMNSIATLLNEDANFCSNPKIRTEHEISSWSIEPNKNQFQKPLKKMYFSSLPPILSPSSRHLSLNNNTTNSLSFIPAISPPPFKTPQQKLEEKNHERIKLTELRSLESFTDRLIDQPSIQKQFQPFHSKKIRPYKRSTQADHNLSIGKTFMPVEVVNKKDKKELKMTIGLVYPMRFYEKYFNGAEFIKGHKVKGRLGRLEEKGLSRNEKYNEMISKVTCPGPRSQSMFAENFTNRNKYLLSPLLRDV